MLQTADDSNSRTLSTREERARQANTSLGRVLRYAGLIAGIALGWNLGVIYRPDDPGADVYGYPLLMAAATGALLFLLTPYLTLGLFTWLRKELRRIEAGDLVAAAVGLLLGGLASTLLALPIAMLPDPFGQVLPFVASVTICTIAVLSTLTKRQELMALVGWRRSEAWTGDLSESDSVQPVNPEILVDTSAIIDGRIAELASRGFLAYRLVVPQFVLHELQLVADSEDYNKRVRGTRGLQTLDRMQQEDGIDLDVRSVDSSGNDVDSQLVEIAQTMDVPILSGDTTLERVAALQNVSVLNLHSLAEIMRPALSVGDRVDLRIVQEGREYQQGVGFLDDGTMIVVDEGEPCIGQTAPVVITRTLQTNSGRMMFARLQEREAAR